MNLISVISNNFDAFITVVVLIMSVILFIKNTIAPELTGLLCVGIFIATGVPVSYTHLRAHETS